MQRRTFMATGMVAGAGMATMGLVPKPQRFYVPPEEARHQRTFMQWPINRRVHPDGVFLDMTQQTIADIANTIADFEPVTMLAHPDDHAGARRKLSSNVELWDIPTEDLWCRDAGPIFVIDGNGAIAVSHIQFNGWGEKQINTRDSQIVARIAARLGLDLIPTGLRGEAGGVEQDGHGLLIAHESSWVNDNRNPGLSRADVETRLLRAYGADRLIWSDGVWGEDITDYHIDSLARFTGPGRILINLPDDPDMRDPFHVAALDTHDALDAAGLEIEVIPEPTLRRVNDIDFVASYANYYVCNGAVIAAQFGDPQKDAIAKDALRRHFPGRDIITLNVDPLGEMGGGIHCATQQMPAEGLSLLVRLPHMLTRRRTSPLWLERRIGSVCNIWWVYGAWLLP
ncbi:porphyromonas-type peptidyl-arginine deiminase family protein [Octadecabacter antarcticus 307]|uniref:Porphyromonas-type peptidyl-arginine deiminase family protein n=2 Tax=Octadecabacter TaxID=53945 RepID=M9RHS6_9RHOB|nr:porphyromonas-type peptidyl-arginine deiminase family protein [Octadecabacter antarcticus 307]